METPGRTNLSQYSYLLRKNQIINLQFRHLRFRPSAQIKCITSPVTFPCSTGFTSTLFPRPVIQSHIIVKCNMLSPVINLHWKKLPKSPLTPTKSLKPGSQFDMALWVFSKGGNASLPLCLLQPPSPSPPIYIQNE